MPGRTLAAIALACGTAASAETGTPLSAIDWLTDSVAMPAPDPVPGRTMPAEPGISDNALPMPVVVAPLGVPVADTVGDPPESVGLPAGLWSGTSMAEVDQRLARLRVPRLPVARALLRDLLMTAAPAPAGSRDGMQMFLARVDALLSIGRLDDARDLLERDRTETPQAFRRWFDIALLTGQENRGCERMRSLPQITPTYPVRVFCLARTDDWRAALVTLSAAEGLDLVSGAEADRLDRFLDDLGEGQALPSPTTPSPLDYLIHEAIGEPLRSTDLPVAFAHAELRSNTGWRARIEGAERLARADAIPPDRLWRIYHERAPAASGGLWERVAAAQALDEALSGRDLCAISATLPAAWSEMRAAGLGHALAARHGAALASLDLDLDGKAGGIARRMGYLSGLAPETPPAGEAFLASLARGAPAPEAAQTAGETDLAAAFAAEPPPRVAELLDAGRTGEALLLAIDDFDASTAGSRDALVDGIATLVAAGLDTRAARAGLEYLLLEGDE